jgi:hypothetical protein
MSSTVAILPSISKQRVHEGRNRFIFTVFHHWLHPPGAPARV